uniref:Lysosomal-associated transmembrane protein 4B n=1 Tax=Otolemur garnettii TaxID=30611 RepID=H0XWD2_OTOGA
IRGVAPWVRFYSSTCFLCCVSAATGTILLGVWYLIINAVVLLILLSTQANPDQHHFSSSEVEGNFGFMVDASMYTAIAISFLMILICAVATATYGAYKLRAAWIFAFFCYQVLDFSLNALVAVAVLVYPNSIQVHVRQLPPNFPYKDGIAYVNPTYLVLIILLFIGIIVIFKGYLTSCVCNCYLYINDNTDTSVPLPYEDAAVTAAKELPPPSLSP